MDRHQIRRAPARLRAAAWAAAAVAAACATPSARAQISFVDMFRESVYEQTSNTAPTTPAGYFIALTLNTVNPGDYSSAQATFPGPNSPQALPLVAPTAFTYESGLFPTLAAFNAAFPTGTYSFSGTKGATTDTTTMSYTADLYPQSVPFLTGTTYSSLQGLNPAQAFTFNFSPFTPGSGLSSSFIFLTITDTTTNTVVVDDGFLPTTTTSQTVAANTFVAGHNYTFDLDYSNRVVFPDDGSSQFGPQIGYDLRTDGTFTAGPVPVPEPASLALLAPAAVLLAARAIRRRRS